MTTVKVLLQKGLLATVVKHFLALISLATSLTIDSLYHQ